MNELEKYFRMNEKRVLTKCSHYFDIYDRHFHRFRNKPVTILEIGVGFGGSLQMWKSYFGKQATIIGVDIKPICKTVEEEQIHVFIGSQSDKAFLAELKKQIPKVDILIDDGSHIMDQQIICFEELFEIIDENGIYLCEDLCTSYWEEFNGGYKRPGTFIEYSKNFIDQINAQYSRDMNYAPDCFTEAVESIHYYNNVLVIEKGRKQKFNIEFSGKIKYPGY
jgi:cephalosporin hydroxylase